MTKRRRAEDEDDEVVLDDDNDDREEEQQDDSEDYSFGDEEELLDEGEDYCDGDDDDDVEEAPKRKKKPAKPSKKLSSLLSTTTTKKKKMVTTTSGSGCPSSSKKKPTSFKKKKPSASSKRRRGTTPEEEEQGCGDQGQGSSSSTSSSSSWRPPLTSEYTFKEDATFSWDTISQNVYSFSAGPSSSATSNDNVPAGKSVTHGGSKGKGKALSKGKKWVGYAMVCETKYGKELYRFLSAIKTICPRTTIVCEPKGIHLFSKDEAKCVSIQAHFTNVGNYACDRAFQLPFKLAVLTSNFKVLGKSTVATTSHILCNSKGGLQCEINDTRSQVRKIHYAPCDDDDESKNDVKYYDESLRTLPLNPFLASIPISFLHGVCTELGGNGTDKITMVASQSEFRVEAGHSKHILTRQRAEQQQDTQDLPTKQQADQSLLPPYDSGNGRDDLLLDGTDNGDGGSDYCTFEPEPPPIVVLLSNKYFKSCVQIMRRQMKDGNILCELAPDYPVTFSHPILRESTSNASTTPSSDNDPCAGKEEIGWVSYTLNQEGHTTF